MTTRTRRETVTFAHSARIKGIDRVLPPGAYEVVTDDEMIEGLSFPSFRRVSTMIMVPSASPSSFRGDACDYLFRSRGCSIPRRGGIGCLTSQSSLIPIAAWPHKKATSLRRLLVDAEAHAAVLRDQKSQIETQLLEVPAVSWPDVAAKARYVLNLYSATLSAQDSPHRDLIASVLRDLARLDSES